MKVLVTGGTGFIGSNLIKALLRAGYDVISLSRRRSGFEVKEIICDLSELPKNALRNLGIDCIVHTAARVGFSGGYASFYSSNVIGTNKLIEAAIEAGVENFVFTSSPSVVFDGDHIFYGDENLPYAKEPKSWYAKTKILAEKAVLCSGLKCVILRPHLVFGPSDTNLLPSIITALKTKKLFKFTKEDFLVDFTFIDDCVDAHLRAIKYVATEYNPRFQIFFISSDNPVFIWQFIDKIAKFLNLSLPVFPIPELILKTFAVVQEIKMNFFPNSIGLTRTLIEHLLRHHFFDISRAKDILLYNPGGNVFEKLNFSLKNLCKL